MIFMNSNWDGFKEFVGAALRNPKSVSTLFPTMSTLSKSLVHLGQVGDTTDVLELGAGSGAITEYIIQAQPRSFLGVELDPKLVDYLEKKYHPHPFLRASAADLKQDVASESRDVVISSLPWTLFEQDLQQSIADEIIRVLRPGGVFLTFICLHSLAYPGARRARSIFEKNFTEINCQKTVVQNLPPANIYLARKGT
jgi:phosphatidylethanolamine/phosphatidyl-N-methylethanolamine N-methyltransferase